MSAAQAPVLEELVGSARQASSAEGLGLLHRGKGEYQDSDGDWAHGFITAELHPDPPAWLTSPSAGAGAGARGCNASSYARICYSVKIYHTCLVCENALKKWNAIGSLHVGLTPGFMPDEWDDVIVKYVYGSFSPTVGLFLLGAVLYGLYKYLGTGAGGPAKS